MGTNRRYADSIDRQMNERVLQTIAKAGELQTLSKLELELDSEPFTRDPQPKPVKAWVRFGTTPVRVDAEVCSYTRSACAIRFTVDGTEHRTWVWASAVTPIAR